MKPTFFLLSVFLISFSCKKDNTPANTSASITALACNSGSFSLPSTINIAYTATATVPYSGGNGVAYTAGTAISSAGVTGLTATLQASTLASGTGIGNGR